MSKQFGIYLAVITLGGCSVKSPKLIQWSPCTPNSELEADTISQFNLQCATLIVPLDYSNPTGQQINLALVKQPASGKGHKIGTIITNPGGPGGSGVSELGESSGVYADLFQGHFDIVSFDPRGIGLSEPYIECHNSADELNGANPGIPGANTQNEWGFAQMIDAFESMWTQCEASFANVMPFLGTKNVARDMDRIREGIGESQINYLGYSYGTLLGAAYAQMFPKNVRAMILDGSVPPRATLYSSGIDSALSYETTLSRFLSECDTDLLCPINPAYTGVSAEDLYASIYNFLATFPYPTIPATYGNLSGLTSGWFITAVANGIADDWEALAEGLYEAYVNNNGTPLLTLAAILVSRGPDGYTDNSTEMYNIVQCVDYSDRPDENLVAATIDFFINPIPPLIYPSGNGAIAPNLGAYGIRISSPLCIGTTIDLLPPDSVFPIQIDDADFPPIVVVSNINDPETPYIWGQAMTSAIQNATLLTWDGAGHTVFASNQSPCIDDAVMNYLITLVPPPLGTTCPATDKFE